MNLSPRSIVFGASVTAVVAAVAAGLIILGSPAQERERRIDDRRVADLHGIAAATDLYWSRHSRLPASLDDLTAEPGLRIYTRDPATSEFYGYQALDSARYEVCATFDRESGTAPGEPTIDSSDRSGELPGLPWPGPSRQDPGRRSSRCTAQASEPVGTPRRTAVLPDAGSSAHVGPQALHLWRERWRPFSLRSMNDATEGRTRTEATQTAGLAERMHFVVADGGDGDDRHVERVGPVPALDQFVADRTHHDEKHEVGGHNGHLGAPEDHARNIRPGAPSVHTRRRRICPARYGQDR